MKTTPALNAFFRPALIAVALAFALPAAQAAVPKDMLVIGKAADPQTLDPAVTIDNNDWTVTYPSYQRLVQYKTDGGKGSTEVEGDLASGWKASDDQKEWTFILKNDAKFADGTPVTADAVKQSFERLLKIGQGPAEAFPKDLKVEAIDNNTVKFTLSQPFAPFLYTLANDGASIINPAVLKSMPQTMPADSWRRTRQAPVPLCSKAGKRDSSWYWFLTHLCRCKTGV